MFSRRSILAAVTASLLIGGGWLLSAASDIPAWADTPTPYPTAPPGVYACNVGLSGTIIYQTGMTVNLPGAISGYQTAYDGPNAEVWAISGSGTVELPLSEPMWVDGSSTIEMFGAMPTGWAAWFYGPSGYPVPLTYDGMNLFTVHAWPVGDWIEITGLRVDVSGGAWLVVSGVGIRGYCNPAPTPTPGATSTAFVLDSSLCITATEATTPEGTPTPTPYLMATATPGGPTATPMATSTPAPASAGLNYSSHADFSAGLQPWTTGTERGGYPSVALTTTVRADIAGPDGAPGVAQVGAADDYITYYSMAGALHDGWLGISDIVHVYGALPNTDMIILPLPQLVDRPINITGKVRSLNPAQSGDHTWIMVWYLDPGDGSPGATPAWIMLPSYLEEYSYTWGQFAARLYPDAVDDFQRAKGATAIGLTWYATNNSTPPSELENAMLLDDVSVTAGDQADAALPICSGTGGAASGGFPFGAVPTKLCVVHEIPVDVFASRCIQPTGIDVPAWLSFWGCHIEVFFTWVDENTAQQEAMFARGARVEPVGTMSEMPQVAATFGNLVYNIGVINSKYTWTNRTVDFMSLLDWHAIDTPPVLTAVTVPDTSYLNACDASIANISNNTKASACWVVQTMRSKFTLINLVQWVLDAGAVIGFVIYFLNQWIRRYG